jgi:protein phosphatase
MIGEDEIERVLAERPRLDDAAAALVEAANAAGGKDNITVVLFRVADGGDHDGDDATREHRSTDEAPVVSPPTEQHESATPTGASTATAQRRRPVPARTHPLPGETGAARPPERPRRRSVAWRRLRRAGLVLALLSPLIIGAWIANRAVFFLGTDDHGQVAVFRGLPYDLPAGLHLYGSFYVSGVPAATVPATRREVVLDHKLRSQNDALDYVRQLELGEVQK